MFCYLIICHLLTFTRIQYNYFNTKNNFSTVNRHKNEIEINNNTLKQHKYILCYSYILAGRNVTTLTSGPL